MSADFTSAYELALKKLAKGDRFESEIRSLLSGYPQEIVEAVIDRLNKQQILNDNRATRTLLKLKSGRRAMGVAGIEAALERRGASEQSFQLVRESVNEAESINELLRSRYHPNLDQRGKAGRFLVGRGFDEEAIESALERFFSTS